MGMFNTFKIYAFDQNLEIQSKNFDSSLTNYYFGSQTFNYEDKNKPKENIKFVKEFFYDNFGKKHDVIICLAKGFFVDFCLIEQKKEDQIKKTLKKIWNNEIFLNELLILKQELSEYEKSICFGFVLKYKKFFTHASDVIKNNEKIKKELKNPKSIIKYWDNPLIDIQNQEVKEINNYILNNNLKEFKFNNKKNKLPALLDDELFNHLPEAEGRIYENFYLSMSNKINNVLFDRYKQLVTSDKNNKLDFYNSSLFMHYHILENNNEEDIKKFILYGGNYISTFEKNVCLEYVINNLSNIPFFESKYQEYIENNFNQDIFNKILEILEYNYDGHTLNNFINFCSNIKKINNYKKNEKNIFDILFEKIILSFEKNKKFSLVKDSIASSMKLFFPKLFNEDLLSYYKFLPNFQSLTKNLKIDDLVLNNENNLEKDYLNLKNKIEKDYFYENISVSSKKNNKKINKI